MGYPMDIFFEKCYPWITFFIPSISQETESCPRGRVSRCALGHSSSDNSGRRSNRRTAATRMCSPQQETAGHSSPLMPRRPPDEGGPWPRPLELGSSVCCNWHCAARAHVERSNALASGPGPGPGAGQDRPAVTRLLLLLCCGVPLPAAQRG